MKITPNTLTLQQFFTIENEQFSIPAYQRRYAWGTKQHRELFDDIRLLPDGDSHLFGTVLFLSGTHTPGINVLELVDGQQRITTLSLLLLTLAHRFKEFGDDETTQDVQKLLRCRGPDKKAQPKVLLGDLDHPDYERLIVEGDPSEVVNRHLAEAFNNFKNWVGAFSDEELQRFHFRLMNSASVIRLDVGQAKDAYKLFETINNRGLRLQPTDIIKNFLLGHASSLGDATLKKVKDQWRGLIVALDGLDSDDFFRQYLAGLLHRKVTANRLVGEFKAHYLRTVKEAEQLTEYATFKLGQEEDEGGEEGEDVLEDAVVPEHEAQESKKTKLTVFAASLRAAAETYALIRNRAFDSTRINRHLRDLERIKSFQAYTLLLDMFQRGFPEKSVRRMLSMIEAFMMRRHICEKRSNELETIYASLTGTPDSTFEARLAEVLKENTPSDEEFEAAFASFPFVPKVIDRARYALEMLEYQLIGHLDEYYLAEPDQLELEHIIPKTIDTAGAKKALGDWPTYLGDGWKVKHAKYLHRIGNMTLLADELNVVASNNPFLAKRVEYKKSNIQLTKELAKLSVFKFPTIDTRSKHLASLAVAIWAV